MIVSSEMVFKDANSENMFTGVINRYWVLIAGIFQTVFIGCNA